jgi:hypothetical protein
MASSSFETRASLVPQDEEAYDALPRLIMGYAARCGATGGLESCGSQ